MKSVDSKFLLGLLVGSAAGAAVGYFLASDKKDKIVDDLSALLGRVKDGFNSTVDKYRTQRAGATVDDDELAE